MNDEQLSNLKSHIDEGFRSLLDDLSGLPSEQWMLDMWPTATEIDLPVIEETRVVGIELPYLRWATDWFNGNEKREAQGMGPITKKALELLPTHCLYNSGNLSEYEQGLLDYNNHYISTRHLTNPNKSNYWLSVRTAKKEIFTQPCRNLDGVDMPRVKFLVNFQQDSDKIYEFPEVVTLSRKEWVIPFISRKHMEDQKSVTSVGFGAGKS